MIYPKKLGLMLLTVLLFCCSGIISAQNTLISIEVKDATIEQVFAIIEQQSDYKFSFRNSILDNNNDITIKEEQVSVDEILRTVLPAKGLQYKIASEGLIVITKLETNSNTITPTNKKISGKIVDTNGEPIIGANILEKSSWLGTITSLDGTFELEVPVNSTITITCIGYITQSIDIGDKTFFDILLLEDVKVLDEVVVVGYGIQKKVNLTGSVSMVSADDINNRPTSNVSNSLQGLLPGVTVINSTGQPGNAKPTIRIRGLGTLGNSDPLILIDGVEGDMSTLNPEDIQSVSVLKDAASSAIYGARAANGVLLITTQKLNNKDQAPSITINSYYGTQTPTRLPEMADALEFMELENEAKRNVGAAISWQEEQFDHVRNGTNPNIFGNTDWISLVLKDYAPQQSHSVRVNGSVGQSGYMLSYRYFDQAGLTAGNTTGEKRHNIRLKLDSYLLDRVSLRSNVGYTCRDIDTPVGGLTSGGGAIYTAMRVAPNSPVRYTDGSWAHVMGATNPLAVLTEGGSTNRSVDEFSLLETLKIDLLHGWDITATYCLVNYNALSESLRKTITFINPDNVGTANESIEFYNSPNRLTNVDYRNRQQTLILQSNFDFDINDKHKISGVVGTSQEWSVKRMFNASRLNLFTEYSPTLNLGSLEGMSNDASASQWAIRSGFGRIKYNYSDKYLAEMNVRVDYSSRFHKDSRRGIFPSFSAAWRLSEESFMEFSRELFNNIKLRGSWGMLGNQYVGSTDYPYMAVINELDAYLSLIGTNPVSAYTQTTLANPNLTWEKIDMLDLGIDFVLLNNRLHVIFDWYNKNTNDILLQRSYPSQLGARPSEENLGSVNNRGWEIDVAWRGKMGKVNYDIGFNLSDVQNKITDLGDTQADLSSYSIRRVGDPIDAFYGYIAEGLMMPEDFGLYDDYEGKYLSPNIPVIIGNDYQPGDIKYKDISGPTGEPDGRLSPEYDRVVIGSALPRYTYNLRGSFDYQGVDLSFSIQGIGKCDGYLEGTARHALQDMAAYPQKIHLERFNLETNPNPDAVYPRLTYNTAFNQTNFSTFWLEDASYLRLKNIQIGYTLSAELTNKAKISKCRVYISGDNLLTFSNFFYAYDPETPISKGGYYPQVKTVVVGLNITFK